MGDRTTVARAEAIEGFAGALRELRDEAGHPSFRTMSGRSRIISHTTLHEAAQGNRLPSWGTTVEFVKACGGDPADYRERWEVANRAVLAACPAAAVVRQPTAAAVRTTAPRLDVPVPPVAPVPLAETAEPAAPAPPAPPADGVERDERAAPDAPSAVGRRVRPWWVGVAAAAVLAAGAGAVWWLDDDPAPPATDGAARHLATECPVRQQNPPAARPAHTGDRAAFIADLTLPDCSHVPAGGTLPKVWRFKNTGSVPWKGYTLHRVDLPVGRDGCQTITDIPVPDTRPGQPVDVRVEVTVPGRAGFCFVRFKMEDASGAVAFPGSRPVNFQVIVD